MYLKMLPGSSHDSLSQCRFLPPLPVELHGPGYHGGPHLHVLPAAVLCFGEEPARSGPSATAVWVRKMAAPAPATTTHRLKDNNFEACSWNTDWIPTT